MNRNVFIYNGVVMTIGGMTGGWISTIRYGYNHVALTTPEAISDLTWALWILTGLVLFTIGRALPKKT